MDTFVLDSTRLNWLLDFGNPILWDGNEGPKQPRFCKNVETHAKTHFNCLTPRRQIHQLFHRFLYNQSWVETVCILIHLNVLRIKTVIKFDSQIRPIRALRNGVVVADISIPHAIIFIGPILWLSSLSWLLHEETYVKLQQRMQTKGFDWFVRCRRRGTLPLSSLWTLVVSMYSTTHCSQYFTAKTDWRREDGRYVIQWKSYGRSASPLRRNRNSSFHTSSLNSARHAFVVQATTWCRHHKLLWIEWERRENDPNEKLALHHFLTFDAFSPSLLLPHLVQSKSVLSSPVGTCSHRRFLHLLSSNLLQANESIASPLGHVVSYWRTWHCRLHLLLWICKHWSVMKCNSV